jgi:hypothetical protein
MREAYPANIPSSSQNGFPHDSTLCLEVFYNELVFQDIKKEEHQQCIRKSACTVPRHQQLCQNRIFHSYENLF